MGEFSSLTMDERRRVHAVVARQVAIRLPLMPLTHEEQLELELDRDLERLGLVA